MDLAAHCQRRYIRPTLPEARGTIERHKAHKEERRNNVQNIEDRWDAQPRKWVCKGVFATVAVMGRKDAFTKLSTAEQNKIWEANFEREGETIRCGFLGTCHRYLHVDNIFQGEASPRRDAWRARFRWIFVQCCISAVKNNLDKPRNKQGVAQYYADFKALPSHQHLDAIRDLVGAPEELPIKDYLGGERYEPPPLQAEGKVMYFIPAFERFGKVSSAG